MFDVEKRDYGDLFTKQEWEELRSYGAFIPDDGCGYWGNKYYFSYDFNCFKVAPENATHVHWFNK